MAIGIQTNAAKLLAEIGFLGLSRGLPEASGTIFSALAVLRPDEEVAAIGLGLSHLAAGDAVIAAKCLDAAPQSDPVVAFACLAHARSGDREMAAELRDELVARGAAPELMEIANDATGAG